MVDPRIKQLANNLVNYSCRVQKGEKVLIDTSCVDDMFVESLIDAVYEAGGLPYTDSSRPCIKRAFLKNVTQEQVKDLTEWDSARMKNMQAYIAVRGADNSVELTDVPQDKLDLWNSVYSKEVHHNLRVKHTKWCVLRYPTPSMAQDAGMSTRAFEDFYFNVCNLDYSKMDRAMDQAKKYLDTVDSVRIAGKDTDLTFSIKDIGWIKCSGNMNIPDGEIYTAPVRNSVNGKITFNTPSVEQSFKFENISLEFRDGKIVDATANDTERLNAILDTDEGARYVGEFSLGVNPYITKPLCDILFDEKIAGSIHFTPGSSYDDAYNGNESAVHWDMVMIQTPEYGGGEIYFDGKCVRKNGRFTAPELECLNPENLK